LLCTYSAKHRGAVRVYSVDHVAERRPSEGVVAIPINFAHGDPVEWNLKVKPNGLSRSCDCVGFECINADGENLENLVITGNIEEAAEASREFSHYKLVKAVLQFATG
jgi:hypothetical protein